MITIPSSPPPPPSTPGPSQSARTAPVVTIQVDGRPGATPEAALVESSPGAVTVTGAGANGANGVNATVARAGEPGGMVSVQITPATATTTTEAMTVRVVHYEAAGTVLPDQFDIPRGRKVHLSARGGNGAPGNIGGDGHNGRPGEDGTDATQTTEATDGANGGNGGNAGTGSHGGAGGAGGIVEVIIDDEHTNLLFAIDLSVGGGKGGVAGRNGTPGNGGPGGKGGKAHEWQQTTGFQFVCTPACANLANALPSSTATSLSPQQQMLSSIMRNAARVGSGAGAMITMREQMRTAGLCKCQGGSTHCLACEKVPNVVILKRPPGINGNDGVKGQPSNFSPRAGADGLPGRTQITVRHANGKLERYTSKYSIELVGFQVIDENDDGIIEPGEHIFIEQIVIHNRGGMPTPSQTRIPVTVQRTQWIIPSDNPEESTVYLPASIPAGRSATIQGRIKAFITPRPLRQREPEEPFRAADVVSLEATMPGIDMDIPSFSALRQDIVISYPLEFQPEANLRTVPRGSSSSFSWKIYNRSTKTYGTEAPLNRKVLLSIMADRLTGISFSGPNASVIDDTTAVTQEIPTLLPGESITLSEIAEIDANAEPYSVGRLAARLHLSPPLLDSSAARAPPQIIQYVPLSVQISSLYIHNPGASFLLVTNSETSAEVVQAWQSFIERDLGLMLDIWNLSLYGSMYEEGDDNMILAQYAKKSVIMLCNSFEYFSRGPRTTIDFCEPLRITDEVLQDTHIHLVVMPTQDSNAVCRWISSVVLPISATVEGYGNVHPTGVSSAADVVESVLNQYRSCASGNTTESDSIISAYTIPLTLSNGRHHPKLRREAKKTLRFLTENLPQERFCICPALAATVDGSNSNATLLILRGVVMGARISARHSSPQGTGRLSALDRFSCISALPFMQRLNLLSSPGLHQFILHSLRLSLNYELYRETYRFLEYAPWPDRLVPTEADEEFLQLHFRQLAGMLRYYSSQGVTQLPAHAIDALRIVLSTTRSQSMLQLSARVVMPLGHRRARLRAFLLKCIRRQLPAVHSSGSPGHSLLYDLRKRAVIRGVMPAKTKGELMSEIARLTGRSQFEVECGAVGDADNVVNEICSLEDWKDRVEAYGVLTDNLDLDIQHSAEILAERVRQMEMEMELAPALSTII